ncbi:MAG TPA: ATP-binding protein [Amaricoccus sp.]|nr:ATP-binding protein [Amaricoccus sp.]
MARASAYLPAAFALVAILVAGLFAERQSRALADLAERAAVRVQVEVLAAGLQRAIGADAVRAARLIGPATDLSATAHAEALVAATGLGDHAAGLRLALLGPGPQAKPAPIADAVLVPMVLPGADGMLAAAPAGGWTARSAATWPIRLLTLLAGALIVGPMLRTRLLIGERQRHINELRDREVELERLSRRLGLALDASKVGVWDLSIDADVLVWDERMVELYGYPPTGRQHSLADWRNRLHPQDLDRAEAEFREAIEVTGRYVSDYRLLLPGGGVRHIRAIGKLYRGAGGGRQIVGVNWDVTADVLRNEELVAKRLEAEGASVAKSEFLATMSHEIRTPMNGVAGMLDLILRCEADPVQRERAGLAADSARRLLSILNDILDLSKLEAHRITIERVPADVGGLVREVVALMAAGCAGRDVEVRASVTGDVPAVLLCDPDRLRQVLMNLVGNAVKFTEAGRVEASVGFDPADGGRLLVAVRDTGVGIPEVAKRHLFQRFAQVDSEANRLRGGTGLGLAISRQLVELMGGEIAVESVPGLGSTFSFWVPAPPSGAALPGREAAAPAGLPALPPARVLVAEDNPTNRAILAAYLAMLGHAARMVTDGEAAVAAVSGEGGAEPFDLVIMDIQMPGMDGLTAAGRIRALGGPAAAVPIIALTANAMQGDREQCLAAGMTDYLAKPVSLEALAEAMALCLGYSAEVSSTGDQPSPGSKLSIAPATSRVSSPRSAS